MPRTMYDSVTASNIPADAKVVGGYINGRYKWSPAEWARFPHAELVRIQIYIPGRTVSNDGDVLDVEYSDAHTIPAQQAARTWIAERKAAGAHPCLYTSKAAMQWLGGLDCDYWLADYTNTPHLLPGSVATQYQSTAKYDLSVCADGWPRTPGGNVPPAAKCVAFRRTHDGAGYWMVGADGGVFGYGNAGFFGSMGGQHLNAPIIAFDTTPDEQGYWLIGEDYGVYAFGNAVYHGHP
jgi:hypothetical protein